MERNGTIPVELCLVTEFRLQALVTLLFIYITIATIRRVSYAVKTLQDIHTGCALSSCR